MPILLRLAALGRGAKTTEEELASFIAYWRAEGEVFHLQWQQNWRAACKSVCSNGDCETG